MSHPVLLRSLLLAGATAAALVGCDVEPGSTTDYDVVAHLDLARLQKASWVKQALGGGEFQFKLHPDGKSKTETCAELLKQADALTLGSGNERVEIYVAGALDRGRTEACFDELDAAFAKGKSKTDSGKVEKVRTVVLGDDLVAVAIGPDPLPAPSRTRLKDLLAAEPSSSGNEALWFTVQQAAKQQSVKYVEGWANADKGFDAHVQIELKDEAAATELHAQATAALLAMKISGEMGDLAKAVKLVASGDTITADVHASSKQMRRTVTAMDAKGDGKGASATIEITSK